MTIFDLLLLVAIEVCHGTRAQKIATGNLENEVAEDELSFIIEFEDEQETTTENGQNLQEQVVAPTTSNEQTNEQQNIIHGVFESEPKYAKSFAS
ncbi:hypothetical protein BpHYR1_020879 [Brachionus plicatilis]|uniref:Uncharacterized protein n=1 Tax=Brachionus plicatilis TaxID=10195 RepID=A0A3M7S4U0_BRAPC|nr:hypothetical protein BpHYR1_020879 [Brachionus plicatilis]